MLPHKTCPYCGRSYAPYHRKQKACPRPECQKARALETRLAREAAKARPTKKEKRPEVPGERERLAREKEERRREKQREYRRRWNRRTWPERREAENRKKRENRRAGRVVFKLRAGSRGEEA